MVAGENVSTLLLISALGIYIHAIFLTISLGLPWVISALLYKWWRTGDQDYHGAARTATGVLGLNFALGAITGTLVEFGLVQAWPGSIFVIATFGFMPLTIELVAFAGEIVLLVLFIVTFGKVKSPVSIFLMVVYAGLAILSGAVITTVNSWLNVPWGTEGLAANIYPFLPHYGPVAADAQALLKLKIEFLRSSLSSGYSSQIIQNPESARTIGLALRDPFVAFTSPYNQASVLHNVNAGTIVGISFALVGYAYRYFRTGSDRYIKIMRAFLPILLILLILQPTLLGDFMGKMVAANQPTKFALMESASTTKVNPLAGLLAYGDPNHPIQGFDEFRKQCDSLGGKTLGELVAGVDPGVDTGSASSISLRDICLSDLSRAESRMVVLNAGYYAKLAAGIVALVSLVGLASLNFHLGILSRLAERLFRHLDRKKSIPLLSFLVLLGSSLAAALGWFVRDGGRKPWTVYGLIYPQELITPVPIEPAVLAFFTLIFVAMALIGFYGIYIVGTKRLRFVELLEKGAGVE